MMFSGLIFLVLGGFVFLVLIIGVTAYISGWRPNFIEESSYKTLRGQTDNSALEILNERYARGEIDEEEYLKRKETLKS